MVEFDTSKIGYSLKLDGKYYNTLDIEGFSHMMRDPSYCYKFYWLEAIVNLISKGIQNTTFDEIIDETLSAVSSERTTRVIDNEAAGSMERRKREGYF